METGIKQSKHTISIIDRHSVEINGIKSICALDNDYVSLDSILGKITIEGDGLEVLDLAGNTGCLKLSGNINGVYFEEGGEKKRKGLFG